MRITVFGVILSNKLFAILVFVVELFQSQDYCWFLTIDNLSVKSILITLN